MCSGDVTWTSDDLPQANVLQKTDVIHGAQTG